MSCNTRKICRKKTFFKKRFFDLRFVKLILYFFVQKEFIFHIAVGKVNSKILCNYFE